MREKWKTAVRLSLVLLLGAVLGAALTLSIYTDYLAKNVYYSRPCLEAINAASVLTLIRRGQRDKAIELLEWQLDEGLLGITVYLDSNKEMLGHPTVRTAIRQAKRYRARYPRKLDVKELDDLIQELFKQSDRDIYFNGQHEKCSHFSTKDDGIKRRNAPVCQ